MIEVSVIIPTFNRKALLERSLQSVLAQEGVSFEVIVVDDGSTDGTGEFISEKFPQVSYFSMENAGPSKARNFGVSKSCGKWIAFLDSDDQWLAGKLAAQIQFFNAHPDYSICQSEEIWIRNGVRVNPMKKHQKYGGMIFEQCLPLCIVSPSAVMMSRELFEEMEGFDETLPVCEDYDLWLRIAARYPIGLIETPFIKKYGGHEDQLSHKLPAMDQYRIQSLKKILTSVELSGEQRKAAEKMLEEKIEIYNKGAIKRGHETILSAKNLR